MLCLSLQKRICFAPARQSGPVCQKNFTAPRRHFADIRHNPPHTAARKTLSTFGKTILTLEKTVSTFVFSKVLTVSEALPATKKEAAPGDATSFVSFSRHCSISVPSSLIRTTASGCILFSSSMRK